MDGQRRARAGSVSAAEARTDRRGRTPPRRRGRVPARASGTPTASRSCAPRSAPAGSTPSSAETRRRSESSARCRRGRAGCTARRVPKAGRSRRRRRCPRRRRMRRRAPPAHRRRTPARREQVPLIVIAHRATRALPIAIGAPSGARRSDGAARDHRERDRRSRPRSRRRHRAQRRVHARRDEGGNPRPDGVELPHVPEVAERRQSRPAFREHAQNGARFERRAASRRTGRRSTAARTRPAPATASADATSISTRHGTAADEGREEVGKRRSDRERADEHAERGAAPIEEPAGGDLHAGRIYPRQRHAGRDAQRDQRSGRSARPRARRSPRRRTHSRRRTAGAR